MKEASMALEQVLCLSKEGNAEEKGVTSADAKRRNSFFDDDDDNGSIWE
jgi:hypothetical protein